MIKNYISLQKVVDRHLEVFFREKIPAVKKISPRLASIIQEEKKFVMSGGKRLRPILMYYGYLAAKGKDRKSILKTSILIELIHSYLLIHDDIIDQDVMRRGKPTLHVAYAKTSHSSHIGDSLAIVAGDMLCAFGYEILANSSFKESHKLKAWQKLNTILSDVTLGQDLDILTGGQKSFTQKEIELITEYKTAKYTIEGPLHLGAILAGTDSKILKILSSYAIPLGKAFQMKDDMLGMFGSIKKTGKSVDSDIKEHKQTMLIIQAQKMANSQQKRMLNTLLGTASFTESQINQLRAIIKETGALDYCYKLIQSFSNQAKHSITTSQTPASVKDSLCDIADYVVARDK